MTEISDTLTAIIAADPHGPFPEEGAKIRCFLRDGQVIDGAVFRVWLDLDTVRIDVIPAVISRRDVMHTFTITPAEGDTWQES